MLGMVFSTRRPLSRGDGVGVFCTLALFVFTDLEGSEFVILGGTVDFLADAWGPILAPLVPTVES
jgi:hypothetical protein